MDRLLEKWRMDRKIVELLILKNSFNQICQKLRVGKRRVRSVASLAKKHGYLDSVALPPFPQALFDGLSDARPGPVSDNDKLLLEHRDWIIERRKAGWHLVTIHEQLPVKVGSSSFYRFVKRHKLNVSSSITLRVVPEIIHAPGESLLVDWGKLADVVDPQTGEIKTLWFLVGVLGFSRFMVVRLVWDNKLATTLLALESMFSELGGVPMKLTSDNPKCFATTASKYEALLNPGFERFCAYYQVLPELLPPHDPQKKGKVERLVPYVRRLYEAHGDFISLEESQKYLKEKMIVANERRHATTKLRPVDVFRQTELAALKALPAVAQSPEEYHSATVRRDGHVRFRGKYYSLEQTFIGKEVFIVGTSSLVEIYFAGKLVESHPRPTSVHQSKATKKHHLKDFEQVMGDNQFYLKRAQVIGPAVYEMISTILGRGAGFVDTRSVWGILNLDKDYSAEKINLSCQRCLECGQVGYRAVVSFMNIGGSEEKKIERSSGNKFVRDPGEYAEQLKLIH